MAMMRDTLQDEGLPGGGDKLGDDGFINRYARLSTLGQGGMGEVRLCRDGRIGREVAMKIVRTGNGAPPDQEARFLREARVQGRLEHPAVVPVYDLGRDPGGTPFFTMKRVNGHTLEEIVDGLAAGDAELEARYNRRKLLQAFTQICLAVDYAHARGVLHRDLKPANIMLGDFGEVYLLDWGLARFLEGSDAPASADTLPLETRHTQVGSVLGTPGYMSPEQARGDAGIDGRSDVYALGSILFEMLTLEPLHRATSVGAILNDTLKGLIDARAATRAPGRDVPPELEAICVRATRLEAGERFASARELCAAVEGYLDGDRDLARRRELADAHAAAAATAADAAIADTTGSLDSRKRALREVGRALALFPDHPGAMGVFVRLFSTPPVKMPLPAEQEIDALEREGLRDAARIGSWVYLSWFLFIPLGLWLGIKTPWAFLLPFPFSIASALLAARTARHPHPQGKIPWALMIVSTFGVAATAVVFGPFIMLPSIAVVNTICFMMSHDRTRRAAILVCGVLSLILPLILEMAGFFPHAYEFRDDGIVVVSHALHFPPIPTRAFILAANLAVIIGAALLIARMRDILTAKERQLYVQTWQLRQLVPDEASAHIRMPVVTADCPLPTTRQLFNKRG
jgi:eukaryotic-like serine/threonine-protein kinase